MLDQRTYDLRVEDDEDEGRDQVDDEQPGYRVVEVEHIRHQETVLAASIWGQCVVYMHYLYIYYSIIEVN